MSTSAPDVTLQINLCAGDLTYCRQTVPALIATHRDDVRETLAVVDCCRPQSTPVLRRGGRYPAGEFAERVRQLCLLSSEWNKNGLIDRVEYLEEDTPRLRRLNKKNCGRSTAWSHDHLGHAFSAYFAGWDCARTRYVLHFDADILLYQEDGYSWVRAAISALENDSRILAASPRIAPPLSFAGDDLMVSVNAPGSGWLPTWRLDAAPLGWLSDWFSTRCHLMDLERFRKLLPLTPARGSAADSLCQLVNFVLSPFYDAKIWTRPVPQGGVMRLMTRAARKLARDLIPRFPLPPEVLLYERARKAGVASIYLRDQRAWFIHPDMKEAPFLTLLPRLLEATSRGRYPEAQRGVSGIQFDAWAAA